MKIRSRMKSNTQSNVNLEPDLTFNWNGSSGVEQELLNVLSSVPSQQHRTYILKRRKSPLGFNCNKIFAGAHHGWMLRKKKKKTLENGCQRKWFIMLESLTVPWSLSTQDWGVQLVPQKAGRFVLNVLIALWVDTRRGICALMQGVHNPTRQGSYQTLITTKVTDNC